MFEYIPLQALLSFFLSHSARAFILLCRGPAAFTAVRYARLADEKNKRRRNVERQKEQIDIEWEGRKDWKEEERKMQKEREMQRMQVAVEEERKREKEKRDKRVTKEREGTNRDESSLTWTTRSLNNRADRSSKYHQLP